MNFLRPSVFDLQTVDSNKNFQSVNEERVRHEIYKCLWKKISSNFTKNFIFQNRNFTCPFSLHLFYHLKTDYTFVSLRSCDPLKQYSLVTLRIFPDTPLIIPQNDLFPLILHNLILTAFQPQLLNRIHIYQKSLTAHWMIKL